MTQEFLRPADGRIHVGYMRPRERRGYLGSSWQHKRLWTARLRFLLLRLTRTGQVWLDRA